MIKGVVLALFLFNCCVVGTAYAIEHDQIKSFISKNYPSDFKLNDAQITQLTWGIQHEYRTHDMELRAQASELHIEITRALNRLYCARLLRQGGAESYNRFVQAQLETKQKNPLTIATFNQLSQHIQNLPQSDYDLIETAAILSALLRSQININAILESVPDVTQKKLLFILFPPQTNFRHMLYTEGGIGMFNYMRTMILHGFIDQEALDLWYAYWIINIAGFRGHLNQHGSIYLDQDVAISMSMLKKFINEMIANPNYDPLTPYLDYKAQVLGFDHLPAQEKLFLTHIACLLRIYDIEQAQILLNELNDLPENNYRAVKDHFMLSMRVPHHIIHTHVPALFGNAIAITNGDLHQVIHKILPAYNAVIIQSQRSSATQLSFNQLSASANIKNLLTTSSYKYDFIIEKNGNVILVFPPA